MQKRCNAIANALALHLFCIKPLMQSEYDTLHLNNAHPEGANAKRLWGQVGWMIIGTGCQVQVFSLILDS